ncbi:coiled-coil domain-containing protein 186 isoform X2 [Cephus cinctus]|uniref:Coiled-coil domain-containing protein 186 isoform X2 n=1 Tax=Cephus cinctus TaxID=211228 RepID=A0AAJ7C670_CEPCN|nr:coiled-coil domain-containing protein 186 isoform X2 [Cephus cinctus]
MDEEQLGTFNNSTEDFEKSLQTCSDDSTSEHMVAIKNTVVEEEPISSKIKKGHESIDCSNDISIDSTIKSGASSPKVAVATNGSNEIQDLKSVITIAEAVSSNEIDEFTKFKTSPSALSSSSSLLESLTPLEKEAESSQSSTSIMNTNVEPCEHQAIDIGHILTKQSSEENDESSKRVQSLVKARPTLADDSKLVKMSLPGNPINLMQSNAQFLNRSRNFLNFITEKSTNIMEKTLLPQHLAVRYNTVMKLTDTGYVADKKELQESTPMSEIINEIEYAEKIPEQNLMHNDSQNENSSPSECTSPENLRYDTGQKAFVAETLIKNMPMNKNISDFQRVDNMEEERPETIFHVLDLTKFENIKMDSNNANSGIVLRTADDVLTNASPETSEINPNETSEINASSPRESLDSNISNSPKNGLLNHPVYLTLLRDYASVKDYNQKLSDKTEVLEKENKRLAAEKNGELYAIQIETLEKTIEHLRHEMKEATTKQETLSKEYTAANKERESMVMKYAVSEKQLIDAQRARDYAERKLKEMLKEQELLQNKVKQIQGERTRICNILDAKCHDLTDAQKEVERLKEEVNVKDVKLKWTQNKLKTEMEARKETQQKLDKALIRINDMKEECDQVRRETQETMRRFQQSEENKAVTLDQQLKEQQARLILERHVTEDKEMSRMQLQKEVDLLKQRQQVLIEENNTLSLKVQELEKNRLSYESNLSNLKIIADQRQKEIVDLVGKVSQLETLKLQLIHTEQCLSSNETEVQRLRQANEELQSDMESCRQREAHMLDFTQKLTDKNVRLQSEFTSIEAKAQQLESEQGPLREHIEELSTKVKKLEESLAQERSKRIEECELLAKHVAEQTQLARNLTQKLEDSQGENAVLRRKQQISLKEMTRELQHCRKRLEAFETASPSSSLDPASRTGSSTSLNIGDTLNGALSDNSIGGDHTLQTGEPDRQTLIDRIVKLQKINVRRAEKLDFLEEHTRTLVEELQKKTKIIQNYILHENFDAMGSNERDRNKAELARHGGIMASVYNHRVSDDNMTLELSLEINQKLQTVLEDTLLKNITLKDNIDTLGEEIARLTMQNNQRKK